MGSSLIHIASFHQVSWKSIVLFLLTNKQINKQMDGAENITSTTEVMKFTSIIAKI